MLLELLCVYVVICLRYGIYWSRIFCPTLFEVLGEGIFAADSDFHRKRDSRGIIQSIKMARSSGRSAPVCLLFHCCNRNLRLHTYPIEKYAPTQLWSVVLLFFVLIS